MKVKLYVEGSNDVVFIGTYLEVVLGFQADGNEDDKLHLYTRGDTIVELLELGGYSTLYISDFQNDIKDDLEDGIVSLAIIDSDNTHNDGGFTLRKTAIDQVVASLPISYFLIPNHQDDGYLETLLAHIVVDEYHAALDCLQAQDSCIKEANKKVVAGRKLKVTPDKSADKAMMGTFMTRLKNKGKDRFKDTSIWNLQHPYLTPLKHFLQTHLT